MAVFRRYRVRRLIPYFLDGVIFYLFINFFDKFKKVLCRIKDNILCT
jgi:hypothetical protein